MKKKHDKQSPTEAEAEGRAEELSAEEQSAAGGGDPRVEPDPAALAEERDRLADQLQRTMADLQNIRKRQLKEMEDARRRAVEGLAAELLPVLDNFDLALAAHEHADGAGRRRDEQAVIEGVRMVRSLLQGVFERHGLTVIPAQGQMFDPNVHEAVGVDADVMVEPGRVSKVMQQGYAMGDRVIRPAKVIVAGESRRGSSAEEPSGGAPAADDGD